VLLEYKILKSQYKRNFVDNKRDITQHVLKIM